MHALRDVNLTVKRGEFVALLGPSGCGKSTALNCIAGLLPLTDGAIWLDEQRIDELGPEERGFGMVFQNYALFPHMTVRRNIAFGLTTQRRPKDEIARRVDEALALVRLDGTARQAARPALRRPAAARGDRPRHRGRAAAGADGRTAVQPRCQAAAGDARGDPAHPHDAGLLDDLRDARPGGGAVAGRPHRGDDRWPAAADRHTRGPLCAARAAPMSPSSWAIAIC